MFAHHPLPPRPNCCGYNWTIDSRTNWWDQDSIVEFEGHTFLVRAFTEEFAADIRLECKLPDDRREAQRKWQDMTYRDSIVAMAYRFFSAMVWNTMKPLVFAGVGPSQGADYREDIEGFGRHSYTVGSFNPRVLPSPQDFEGRLALSLYREATTVNSDPYSLLGYFRILEITNKGGKAVKDWIKATYEQAVEQAPRLVRLGIEFNQLRLAPEESIEAHLYHACRCSVAHANDPRSVIDPDNLQNLRTIGAALPHIHLLARHIMVHELNIPESQ